ncbi:MAG TPA: hypothetical protein VN759_01950 [Pseudolysinimonas sp.]|nr:hypothetical protein [Pseudolysinimonas sp.]
MTTLVLDDRDRAIRTAVWNRVTDDLWAASDAEGFLGTVELVAPGRYAAIDGRRVRLGSAATLRAAQELITVHGRDAVAFPAAPSRLTAATAWIAGLAAVGALAMLILDVTR